MNTRAKACRAACPDKTGKERINCRTRLKDDGVTCLMHLHLLDIEERKRLERKVNG